MKKHLIYMLAFSMLVFGCAKEKSFESGGSPSEGSLQSDATGDCFPKTVSGVYEEGLQLVPATNLLTVQVDVTTTGTYTITTDTVNGYFFSATGTFTTLGLTNVNLRGNGTPFAAGINNFVVRYDSTICDVQVTVLPPGSGGPAVFTLQGSPNACTGAVVNGAYAAGVPLGASNTVVLSVNVTSIGTYNISTTLTNGMTFTGSGAFAGTGVQNVTLTGTGTPGTAGNSTIPVTAGTSNCTFSVTVSSAAAFTIDCSSVTVNGTYVEGVPLNG